MNRRTFLKIGSMGLGALALPGCTAISPGATSQPNIVFILADDLGRHQLGCYGSTFYETPHIDRLARQGMKFTNAYAACPVCSPTRASIMTGKYPARLHLTDYIPGVAPMDRKLLTPDWKKYLPLEEITLAEMLKSAGYVTGHFGKWHLNKDKKYQLGRPGDPGSQGFDDVLTTHKPGAGPESIYQEDWHHVREITETVTGFIEKNKTVPFFCYISHNSIHDPEIEKQDRIAKYQKKPDAQVGERHNPIQGAMLETLDESVGTILEKLEELGLEHNTLVIFFSDNGQKGVKEGLPFRGSKGDLYEGGIRMPLVVRWPNVIKAGSVCEEIVISNDFFPTFHQIINAKKDIAEMDGVSLLALLKNSHDKLEREAIYWHYPHYHGAGLGPQGAIRQGNYKLIEWYEKSIYGEEGALELYDLEKDPAEQNNLVDTMPELAKKLQNSLQRWRIKVGAQEMSMNPDYKINN